MICNYINALPRCQQGSFDVAGLQSEQGLIARQTQQKLRLEVGELGYLSSQYTGAATLNTITLSLVVASLLCSTFYL